MGRDIIDNDAYKAIAGALFGMALGTLSAGLSGTFGAHLLQNENQTNAYGLQSTEMGVIGGCMVGGFTGLIGGFASKSISSSGFFKEYSPIMNGITFGTSVMPLHLLNSIIACFLGYAILENWSNEIAMNFATAFITFLIGATSTALPVGLIGIVIGIPVMTKIIQTIEDGATEERKYTTSNPYNTFN